jgi:polysaccharide export outer membrane protein
MKFAEHFEGLVWSVLLTSVLTLAGIPATAQAQGDVTTIPLAVNPMLQPGDLVRVKIWREPSLSGDYRVDEEGVVLFPKIGAVPASRLPTDSVKAMLTAGYAVYLRNPSVEVTFLRRVNVLGAVKNPGLYHVDPTMTVSDVVALAGGVNPEGNPDRIELLRQGRRLPVRLSSRSPLASSPIRSGDQLQVDQRSWLSRNTAVVGAGITAATLVLVALIRP